jgi:hypothetical protein
MSDRSETATVSSLFEMPDEDAEVIMSRVTKLVHKHKMIPDVVKELTAKYGEEAILTGMIVQKTIDRNNRAAQLSEASEGFGSGTFLFGEALGIDVKEATEICDEVGNLSMKNPKWKAVFAAVGRQFGERAVYAGAFLLYLYTKAEGEPVKKHDYGRG